MALLARKLKNEILKVAPDAVVQLKNIRINGEARGCSGSVSLNGRSVYVDTDCIQWTGRPAGFLMRRNDVSKPDGRDCRNQWGLVQTAGQDIVSLLTESESRWAGENDAAWRYYHLEHNHLL